MFKDYDDYKAQRDTLINEAQTLLNDGKMDEYRAKCAEVTELDNTFETWSREKANLAALQNGAPNAPIANTSTSFVDDADKDYRMKFMNYILHGGAVPKMQNVDQSTSTSDVAAVIPETLVNRIISKLESYGKIYAKVTKTFYKGGVSIPTSAFAPAASWVAEGAGSDRQKATTSSISFTYHKLRCSISMSLETSEMALDVFETYFVESAVKAMMKAIEAAIISGTGATYHQPEGILTVTPVTGQKVEITEGGALTYANLLAAEAILPEAYEAGAEWYMKKATFFNNVLGLVDANDQPIARVNVGIDGKPEYAIFGRPVNFNENVPSFATSVSGDTVFAFIFRMSDYVLNENLSLTVKEFEDNDTDERVKKAIMLVDGKVADKNSYVPVMVKNS